MRKDGGVNLMTVALLVVSGCVNARVYSDAQLAGVAQQCGVDAGDIAQEPDQPRFLFLLTPKPSPAQLGCVSRWSRRHHMHLGFIQSIEFKQ